MTPFEMGITLTGSIHIAFVCIFFILSLFVTLSTYFILHDKVPLRIYSLITSIILLVMGIITGISFLFGMLPGFGLIERICTLSFMIWILVISIVYKKIMR
jgi:hypothetical protein